LAAVFRKHGDGHVRAYADPVAQLGFSNVRGYLTGAVDLVFRWAPAPGVHPRWYVVDYKTNYLGDDWGDYAADALPAAMSANHYVLQYHLYAVALHRHLRRVLPGYAYKRDFGGVYYLFVRGMRAEGEAGAGIYHDRPPAALIDALDELLRDGTKGARP
jgi:exodeoxyribonuclease V beta subunit